MTPVIVLSVVSPRLSDLRILGLVALTAAVAACPKNKSSSTAKPAAPATQASPAPATPPGKAFKGKGIRRGKGKRGGRLGHEPRDYFRDRTLCPKIKLSRGVRENYPQAAQVVAQLKYTLLRDDLWSGASGEITKKVRRGIVSVLGDHEARITFSPSQVPEEHLRGKTVIAGQAIGRNKIRLSPFAGKNHGDLARTLLHELVHLDQVRRLGKEPETRMQAAWELPAYSAESFLPMRFIGPKTRVGPCARVDTSRRPGRQGSTPRDSRKLEDFGGQWAYGLFSVTDAKGGGERVVLQHIENVWTLTRSSLGWGIGTETLKEMGGDPAVMAGPFKTEKEAAAAYCDQVVAGSFKQIPLANDAYTFDFTDGKRHNVSRMKSPCYICADAKKNLPKAHCG